MASRSRQATPYLFMETSRLTARKIKRARRDGKVYFATGGSGPVALWKTHHFPQHPLFFLHAPSFFNSSQLPVICNRCVFTEKPNLRLISLSSFSILSLSNSTIFSQSLQMM